MKKIYAAFAILSALFLFSSCDEWDPVLNKKYSEPEESTDSHPMATTTIKALKDMYSGTPLKIDADIVIAGQVISSDKSGNFYRTMYIQDETGAIEVKVGLSGLYNEYKLGQWIYVDCGGLTIGAYGGMVQLGYEDPSGKYETAYLDVKQIISDHIYRGDVDDVPNPWSLTRPGYRTPIIMASIAG